MEWDGSLFCFCKPWDEKDAAAVEEEFSLEDLFGDDTPGQEL